MARDGEPFDESSGRLKDVLGNGQLKASELRRRLGWTWGRFIYVLNKMIDSGDLHHALVPEGNKMVKIVSFLPIAITPVVQASSNNGNGNADLVDICTVQNELINAMMDVTLEDFKDRMDKIGVTAAIGEQRLKGTKIGMMVLKRVLELCNVTDDDLGRIDATLKGMTGDVA